MYVNSSSETATTLAEVCRSCLSMESKTTPLSGDLESLFSMLTGLEVRQWEPSSVCYLCLAVLVRCKKYKEQCRRVNEILVEMMTGGALNLSRIKTIDRIKYGLNSLTKVPSENISIDLYPILLDPIKEETDDKYLDVEFDRLNTTQTLDFDTPVTAEAPHVSLEQTPSLFCLKTVTNNRDNARKKKNVSCEENKANNTINNNKFELDTSLKNLDQKVLLENCKNNIESEYEIENFNNDFFNLYDDSDSDIDLNTIKLNTNKIKNLKINKQSTTNTVLKSNSKRQSKKEPKSKLKLKLNKVEKNNKISTKKKNLKNDIKKQPSTVLNKVENDSKSEISSVKKKFTYEDLKKAHEIFKENFKIYKFDIDEQIKEFNRRKESPAYLERPFKCDICFKGFHMASVHKRHMVLHEERTPNYCTICRIYFKTRGNYKVHKHQHEHKYTCMHCDFVSDRRSSASTHVKSHSGNIQRCLECGREFRHLTSYANHLRVAHPSRFACADCGFAFVSQAGREKHIAVAHRRRKETPPDGPECVDCKIKFSNENALVVHIGISHPDKSSTKGKMKYINDNYKNTMKQTKYSFRKKNKPMDIVCEKCGEHLRTQLQYHWHFTKKHPSDTRTQYPQKSVLCDLCGKTLKSELHLKYHMEDHNKTVIFRCETCPMTFSNRFAFYRHKYAHKTAGLKKSLPAQRHACAQCGMSFSSYSNRNRHVKLVHSNERHFFCEYCSKGFKSDQEKKTHIEHVHFKKPWPKRSRGRAKTAQDDGPSDWPTN